LRTTAGPRALTVLEDAGAAVTATSQDTLTVAGLSAERIVAVLTRNGVPFSEVAAHRASLEQAYMDLTSAVVEYRAEPA
jgi:ABC-2 type transport system ATP-binding protein